MAYTTQEILKALWRGGGRGRAGEGGRGGGELGSSLETHVNGDEAVDVSKCDGEDQH